MINKIKKVFISFGLFLTGALSSTFAVQEKYGVFDPGMVQAKYGVYNPNIKVEPVESIWEKILGVGKFIVPVVLFIVGLVVVLNKNINKKVRITLAIILALLLYLFFGAVIIDIITTNFRYLNY